MGIVSICCCLAGQSLAQTTWRRTYGGLGAEEARSVIETSSGGFLFCGSTGSFGDGGDVYVFRTGSDGILEWSAFHGGPGAQVGVMAAEVDGGYILAGTTSLGSQGGYDMLLLRLGPMGELVWSRNIGGPDWDLCRDMKVVQDGFVLVGISYGPGAEDGDALVARTNAVGDTLWTRLIGGSGNDEALGVDIDPTGNILVSGRMDAMSDDEDAFVSKLSPEGDLLWTTRFGGDSADYVSCTVPSGDGGYVTVGGTRSYADISQALIRKLDVNGESIWQREHGTPGSTGDMEMRRLVRRADGGYAMVGFNSALNAGGRDMFLVRLNPDGYWETGKNYGGFTDEEGYGIGYLNDGGFILAGTTDGYGPGFRAVYAIRCAADSETEDDTVFPTFDTVDIDDFEAIERGPSIYPNPSTGIFSIGSELSPTMVHVTDICGKVMERHNVDASGQYSSLLPSGIYLVELWSGTSVLHRGRLLIVRD